ncbi:MAG: hypothetical protein AAFX99_02170, partial [Myxococcota bacterium]
LTRGLRHLSLAENPLGDDVSRLFTTTPHTLYSLKLNDIQCTDALAHTLAERPESTALRTLDLSGNAITDEGAKMLAQSPHLTHLTSLRLLHCPLTDVGRNALAHSSVLQGCAVWIDEGTSVHPLWGKGV